MTQSNPEVGDVFQSPTFKYCIVGRNEHWFYCLREDNAVHFASGFIDDVYLGKSSTPLHKLFETEE